MGEHKSRVDMFDADGKPTGHFSSVANRPMFLEATDENGKKFTVDSRGVNFWSKLGESLMEFAMLGWMMNK